TKTQALHAVRAPLIVDDREPRLPFAGSGHARLFADSIHHAQHSGRVQTIDVAHGTGSRVIESAEHHRLATGGNVSYRAYCVAFLQKSAKQFRPPPGLQGPAACAFVDRHLDAHAVTPKMEWSTVSAGSSRMFKTSTPCSGSGASAAANNHLTARG